MKKKTKTGKVLLKVLAILIAVVVVFTGVATALSAEFIEVLKYIDGAAPYEAPCYGHLSDAVIRTLGVPLVTGDIPGVSVIIGEAASAEEASPEALSMRHSFHQ